MNIISHSLIMYFNNDTDNQLSGWLQAPLPNNAKTSTAYSGPTRLIVPTVRTEVGFDEQMFIKAIILTTEDNLPIVPPIFSYRSLEGAGSVVSDDGPDPFTSMPMDQINPRSGRAIYGVRLPVLAADFEWFISATVGGEGLVYPVTAPYLCQTVIVGP